MLRIEVIKEKQEVEIELKGSEFELFTDVSFGIKGIIVALKEAGFSQGRAEEFIEYATRTGVEMSRIEEKDGTLDD